MNLVSAAPLPETKLRAAIAAANRRDETAADAIILADAALPAAARQRIAAVAHRLVAELREKGPPPRSPRAALSQAAGRPIPGSSGIKWAGARRCQARGNRGLDDDAGNTGVAGIVPREAP